MRYINPILPGGGGHYGPPYHESVCRCRMVRTTLTKLPDFVPFHISQVPESQFWRLFFKKLKKLDVENFWGSSSIRQKSENFEFFYFFTNKPYFFNLNLNCTVWTSKFVQWKPPVETPHGGVLPQKVETPHLIANSMLGGFHFLR